MAGLALSGAGAAASQPMQVLGAQGTGKNALAPARQAGAPHYSPHISRRGAAVCTPVVTAGSACTAHLRVKHELLASFSSPAWPEEACWRPVLQGQGPAR